MSESLKKTPFTFQLQKADGHSVASWHHELEIVKAFKIAQDDENREDEAIALEKLGDVYNARACLRDESLTLFSRLDQFILATALYNSSLIRSSEKNKLEAKLREIEKDIISCCGGNNMTDDFQADIDKKHKSKLNDFRAQCEETLKSFQKNFIVFTSPLHIADTESEVRRAAAVRELFEEIRKFMKEAVANLLEECIQVIGSPPGNVSYAFVGFGSFARGEVTPFSDIEFALLIEEGKNDKHVKEYFIKLLEYFNYKVLNLQETILPSMCIPSLNDENNLISSLERYNCTDELCPREECSVEAADWPFLGKGCYDGEMRGFSVDGRMSKACKTPLGHLVLGRGQNKDLIKTPNELAALYDSALKCDLSEKNDYHLSTVLNNVFYLYGSDPQLVDTYDACVLMKTEPFHGNTKLNPRQLSAIQCLKKALDQFQFFLTSKDIGLVSSIKKKLYRAVGMLITYIGKFQYSGVVDNSPWNTLDRLRDDGIISFDAYRNLLVIVGIVNEVRLMAYLRCGRQDEIFSFFDQSMDVDFALVRDFFVRFFYTIFPFQKAVKQILSTIESEENASPSIQFPQDEIFYEYTHLNSAIALSFTSYRYFNFMIAKFAQAYRSAENEDCERLCLAYLSCLHPDYTSQYSEKMLATIGDGNSSEWKIFAYLIAAMASFHQDNTTDVEKFLNAAIDACELTVFSPDSTTEVTLYAYNKLILALLEYRKRRYNEASMEAVEASVLYESIMQSRGNVTSLFELGCMYMSGNCDVMLGRYDDGRIETAMRKVKYYPGNGDNMRILYHTYMTFLHGSENDQEIILHVEKILELFLRFRCPKGQEIWASILVQGVILGAMYLGLLYRNMGRVDDALRVFRLASSRVIKKALSLCSDDHHVGKMKAENARMCIEAFEAIFKLCEAECLHFKDYKDEMWTCIADALGRLANYRGKFQGIEQSDVFAEASFLDRFQLRGRGSFPVWRSSDISREHAAPRFLDAFTMAPLLASWCDALTRAMQFILHRTEQDVSQQLLRQGSGIVALVFPDFFASFQANPCGLLRLWIPELRCLPVADQMIGGIFSGVNSQRMATFQMIKSNARECQHYAIELLDYWKELFFLFLRFGLCHDLLNSLGFLER